MSPRQPANSSMRPSKLRVPLEPAGRAGSPVTAKARCALAPRLAGSSTSASALHEEAWRRSCACLTFSVRGSGAPVRGQRSVPPWRSIRPSRQRDSNRAPALSTGSCPAPPARAPVRSAPAPRSMSGSTSVMRPASSRPLRTMRQASRPTMSCGARSSAPRPPGSPSTTLLNTASGPYQPQRTPSSLKLTLSPVCWRISSSCAARCCGTRAAASSQATSTTAPRMVAPPSIHSAQRSPARAERAAPPPAAGATGPAAGSAGFTRTLVPLDEYDVVVINAVEGLDLQTDRTTDLRLELAQGGRLLVQEAIHDVLVSEYQQLTTGKLSALSHNFPKNLVAHRFGRADETAPRAAWTRLTQQMFQALAGALAGHFHEPERREAHDVGLGAITGQRALEGGEHRTPVRLIAHVDEVDDDDAAEIAQPQLPRDAHRRLEVGAEDGFLQIAMTHIGAGVHVDSGHRLGLVDHQVTAGLQRYLALERLGDFLLDAVEVEQRARTRVQLDRRRRPGHESGGKLLHARVLGRRIHQHAAHAAGELIAQHPQRDRKSVV